MRRLPSFVTLLCLASPVGAHDFWVQPLVFAAPVNAPMPFTIQVGHGTFRQRWGAAIDRIVRFDDVGPTGTIDRRAILLPPGGPVDGTAIFATPGTHILVLQTGPAESTLPSIRFNDYIKVEGLTPAIATRERLHLNESDGRELYSRRAKALVQVGDTTAPQPQVTRAVGLTLEIVPQRNPYSLAPNDPLPVRILYQGKPLANALVKLNNLDFDARPIETHLSDAQGMASFNPPRHGKWQLNVIWTKPLTGNPKADFETIFSSLTFGFPSPRLPVQIRSLPGPSSN